MRYYNDIELEITENQYGTAMYRNSNRIENSEYLGRVCLCLPRRVCAQPSTPPDIPNKRQTFSTRK